MVIGEWFFTFNLYCPFFSVYSAFRLIILNYRKLNLNKSLVFLLLLLLTACSNKDIRQLTKIATADDPGAAATRALENTGRYYASNPEQLPADIRTFLARLEEFRRLIATVWGEADVRVSGPKDYVKYTDHYYNRAHVDFEAGKVTVETLAPDNQQEYLKKAIVTTLLTPDDPGKVDLYSDTIPDNNGKPFLYEQVLDHDGEPIAWSWRANRYADYLIKNRSSRVRIGKRYGLKVEFPLVAKHQQLRAYKYASLVRKYSNKYQVTESLIYGIIKTESAFNPFAVSSAPAYGLMQVVPGTAGKDVFDKVKNRPDQPSPQYLLDPENNIDTGTAYLQILQERYLDGIRDNNSLRYSVISAYNGGAGNVLKTFSADRDRAVDTINKLSSTTVYDRLTTRHPVPESRRYLYKVNEAQKEFWRNEGFSQAP